MHGLTARFFKQIRTCRGRCGNTNAIAHHHRYGSGHMVGAILNYSHPNKNRTQSTKTDLCGYILGAKHLVGRCSVLFPYKFSIVFRVMLFDECLIIFNCRLTLTNDSSGYKTLSIRINNLFCVVISHQFLLKI